VNTVVVLPTYNEAGTIVAALEQLSALSLPLEVLVVDDMSPDGTGDLVRRYIAESGTDRVSLLERPGQRGLGQAYRDGFSRVLAADRYDVVVQVDADGSHPFGRITEMVELLAAGAGLVIGSRYCPGGTLTNDWPVGRRLLSRAANVYTKAMLGLPVADTTSGYRAWRTGVLRRVLENRPSQAEGYVFMVQMLKGALCEGAEVKEIPIAFGQRIAGVSKLTAGIAIEGIWTCLVMRFSPGKVP
jgi:glycosyltransferase involved in cell wall biosynthesis